MAKKVILDCDPGHDDAIAILLAHGSPALELLAVTTVAGNQTLEKVTANALAVATIGGITDVPIAAGAPLPLVRPQIIAEDIHGDSGMDGPALPAPAVELDPRHGVDLIIETVLEHPPGEITLIPTGPLTNIAMAVQREPAIVERVAEVVLMGGGYSKGNTTPAAEFNILVDPEAAAVVFNADWKVTMVGLDLTHQAVATPDVVERFAALNSEAGQFVVDLLEFFGRMYKQAQGFDAPPVHDACAVARVIDPDVLVTKPAHVVVELTGTHTTGMTVTDFWGRGGVPLRTQVATELNREKFWNLVVDAISRIDPTN